MSDHSTILGGSNAARLLACPASFQESLKAPVSDLESVYAAEGTMLHEIMPELIKRKASADSLRTVGYRGKLQHILIEEQIETLASALDALEAIKAIYDDGTPWKVVALESRLKLRGVTGAFGTVDLILANSSVVIVLDWKFGSGVPVYALYALPDGSEQLNAQGAFYACCGRASYPRQFKGKTVVIAIVQPRLDPPYTLAETDAVELDDFHLAFGNAIIEAMGRNAHRERGEHCRFAVCKATCCLWTGPLLDISKMDPTMAALRGAQSPAARAGYSAFLSSAMSMVELAETWAEEIRRQAHAYLSDGGLVDGWKLVPKRGTRQWVGTEGETAEALMNAGVDHVDIYTAPVLKSVAQVEKAIKAKKIELPAELYHTVSSGTTIAHDDDKRPTATHATALADMRTALKTL